VHPVAHIDHSRGAFSRLAALRLLAKRKLFLVAAPCQPPLPITMAGSREWSIIYDGVH
jgi:hypothetical protein